MKLPLVIIAGPTASGKTALSLQIAEHFGGEIISADSMQIYRGMDIGTAKPTADEMRGIPHHLIDIAEPSECFSAADYCNSAKKSIASTAERGLLPVMVGGTGLYIDSVVNNVDFGAENVDLELRKRLTDLAEKEGYEAMHARLAEVDPETAQKYHPNNIRRIIRALEFYMTCGETISANAKKEKTSPYDYVYFCIDRGREELYERINTRVDIMFNDGLEAEARRLYDKFAGQDLTSLQGIGYKELFDYFDGNITLAEAAELIKTHSRQYAKRQLTWFKRNKNIHWLTPDNMYDEACDIINKHFRDTK